MKIQLRKDWTTLLCAVALFVLATGCGSGDPDGVSGIQFGLEVSAAPAIPLATSGLPIIDAADLAGAGGRVEIDPPSGMVHVEIFGLPQLPTTLGDSYEYQAVLALADGDPAAAPGDEEGHGAEMEVGHISLDTVGRGRVMRAFGSEVDLQRAASAHIQIAVEPEDGGLEETTEYVVLEGKIGTPLPGGGGGGSDDEDAGGGH